MSSNIKSLLDWWAGLDWKYRGSFSCFLLFLSTVLLFFRILWIWGWLVGTILLLLGGRSKSEKNGYRF
jgi:hypothetical protein